MSEPLDYAVGEWPEPIDYQFLDSAGVAINLTGFTASATVTINTTTTSYTTEAAITDIPNGTVTFTWPDGTLTVQGTYTLIIWVTSASNRYASVPIDVRAYNRGGIPA